MGTILVDLETRKMKQRFAILLILILAGGGCTYAPRSSEGTQISSAKIQELKIGQTNHSDLDRLFGPPTKRAGRADGTEVWQYTHTRVWNPTLGGAVVIEPIQKEVDETFEIVLKDGVVQSYKFLKQSDGGK
jgi:outer membrane protein assembly factor BamE (lipoprotein component of BamABCDE complex)